MLQKRQKAHYLNNPSTIAVVSRAGGDFKNPKAHNPAWQTVKVEDDLFVLIGAQFLIEEEAKVNAKWDSTTSQKERSEQRLHAAKGSLASYRNKFARAFQMAAARPHDAQGKLATDSNPIYKLFQGKFRLFALPVFNSPQFIALVADVKLAQEREAENNFNFPEPAKNEVRSVMSLIIVPEMGKTQAEMRNVAQKVDQMELKLDRLGINVEGLQKVIANLTEQLNYHSVPAATVFQQASLTNPSIRFVAAAPIDATDGQDSLFLANMKASLLVETKANGSNRKRRCNVNRSDICQEYGLMFFSNDVTFAQDIWNEFNAPFKNGRSCKELEEAGDSDQFRKSIKIMGKVLDTSVKGAWSNRLPLFNLIQHHIDQGLSADDAVSIVEVIVAKHCSVKGKIHFQNLSKELNGVMKEGNVIPRFGIARKNT